MHRGTKSMTDEQSIRTFLAVGILIMANVVMENIIIRLRVEAHLEGEYGVRRF